MKDRESFTYDVAGRVASVQAVSGRREEYACDSLARLSTWTRLSKGAVGGDTRQTTFHYDTGPTTLSSSTTVTALTLLRDLVRPDMGVCLWAACRVVP